jgi:O-methyltransferase involved in polyketide biosynthesis
MAEPLIRDISDTARWMAVFRARESERPDAVFKDPFAQALAGDEFTTLTPTTGSSTNSHGPWRQPASCVVRGATGEGSD